MPIVVLGLSHKTAPVEIREKLTFPQAEQGEALKELLNSDFISEAVIVSTCNRTEVYFVCTSEEKGKEEAIKFISSNRKLPPKSFQSYLYSFSDRAAVYHLLRVVSSLDSMVVGEAQILGQIKKAYEVALESGATRAIFNRLFRQALEVGKLVRTETSIGESAVSISYAAVQLAKNVFEDLSGRRAMIIGAGEMGELTVVHLLDCGIKSIYVVNRTFKRAVELARKFGGQPFSFEQLYDCLAEADIVISSTGATGFVVTEGKVAEVMKKRKNRPLFFIDIAVPRDVEPAVGGLYNVFLYDIDDLEQVVESNKKEREKEAQKAESIIEGEVEEFFDWLSTLEVVPLLSSFRRQIEEIKNIELETFLNKMPHLSEKEQEAIRIMAHRLVNKFLHNPTLKLKKAINEKDGYNYIEALRFLFDLSEEEKCEEE